ncbi:MAG TPA: hypothetical protein DEP45_12315 [Armatimonadetes bacterium]|nr:hypothetical protein [Armatimonadota bacterium]
MRAKVAVAAVALAVGAVVLAGCGGGGGGVTPAQATLRGTVLNDGTLAPIAGATIRVGSASVQSDANGVFSIQAPVGSQMVTIAATGFQQLQTNVSVQDGVNQMGTRCLQPVLLAGRGAVSGTVRRGGTAAGGATIRSGNATATSRADGTFSIYNLLAGSQALTAVSADGLATGSATATVQAGTKIAGVTISLGLMPPSPPVF